MADDKKSTHRQRLPVAHTPSPATIRWVAEQTVRAMARTSQLEVHEAYFSTARSSGRSFATPRPATPFRLRSRVMSVNNCEFKAGATNPERESADPKLDSPPGEGSNVVAEQKPTV